ncbi:PKD domain protein [compost metagenome]
MVKHLLFFTVALFFFQISEVFSQISIGTVDPGPYTPGSSIAATFTIESTCIKPGNKFNLYLVRPDGTEVLAPIGSYDGFYSTFVNGTIPPGTPAGTYTLRVKSTSPAFTSSSSTPFEIRIGSIANPILDSETKPSENPRTFGLCEVDDNTPNEFEFTNESSTGNVIVNIKSESALGTNSTLTFTTTGDASYKTFIAAKTHYTLYAKATMPDGSIGTKAYFLINNPVVTAFETSGGINVCFPEGKFEYEVGTNIKSNFPGNIYKIDWGDGTVPSQYTYCDIVDQNFRVNHLFNRSSCGLSYTSGTQTFYNAFAVNVGVISPFCNAIGRPLSTPARVITRPINSFDRPEIACLGSVTFPNTSVAGENPNPNAAGCSPSTMRYTWFVDGVQVSTDFNLTYNFTTTGTKIIRLESRSVGGVCQAEAIERTICIQNPPKPAFTLSSNLVCISSPTITANSGASIIDNTCPNTPVYTWTVTPSAGVIFNRNDVNPSFTFPSTGIYDITLFIRTGTCEVSSLTQKVAVNTIPQATLSVDKNLCARGNYTFGPNGSVTNTTVSGTVAQLTDTYTWTVTGGDYEFVAPYNANSQYPIINFKDFSVYTITLVHKNNCETATDSQNLTFSLAPTAKITATPSTICYADKINLTGVITNGLPNTTYEWIGAGTFTPATGNLITVYTPTPTEQTNGVANIKLLVTTGITGTCAQVEDNIAVTIRPNNVSTNPAATRTQSICTGELAKFNPTAVDLTSTFTWTAVNTAGTATGFSSSGSGNINEAITNTSPTQNAVVEYTITPATTTCTGVPFTFTVTITPKPIIDPIADKTICSGNSAALTVTSNIQTKFIWTSVATNGITGNIDPSTLSAASSSITINDVLSNPSFTPGTVTYTIKSFSASATECEGNTTTVVVTVYPEVTKANAGPDDSICATSPSNTYTLQGNEAKVGTGKWRLVSTHAVAPGITDINDYKTTVTGLVAGVPYIFEWAITGTGECANTDDQVQITVTPLPVISAPVTTKTICHGEQAAVIINSDIPTKFTWTSIATPGITGNIDRTDLITVLNTITIPDALLNSTFTQGKVTYTVTPYSATGCPGTPITIVVNVDPKVTDATAGANTSICNTTTFDLEGSEPKVGTGLWELFSATAGTPPVTIVTPTNFKTNVTGLEAGGVYVFKWTITGTGVCQKSEAQVTITVNMPTVPGTTATTEAIVCQNNNTGTITLSGQTGSVLSWQHLPDGQATWVDLPGTNTGLTYTFTNLSITTQFRAVVQNAGCILGYSTPTAITVAPATTIAEAVGQILCNETSVNLKGNLVKAGETGVWTMISGDATAVITPGVDSEASVAPLIPGTTYVFRWTITGNSPCGPTFKDVTIRNNAPIAQNSITTSSVVCNGQQITINGSVPTGGEEGVYNYVWERQVNGAPWAVIPNETGEDLTITLNTTGTIIFKRTVNSGTCTSTTTDFPITVRPPIGNNNITADQTICSGLTPASINGTLPTGGNNDFKYQWQYSIDGTTNWTNIPGELAQDYQPPILTETIYYRRIVSTVECTGALQSESTPVKITVKPNAKAEFTWGTIDQGCVPYTLPVQVVAYADRNATYTWYADDVLLPSTGSAFPGYTIQTSGKFVTIKLVVTSSLGCSTDEFRHTFSTNQAVPASFDQSATNGCGPLSVNFTNTSILNAGARFKWDFGNGQTSTAISPTGIIFDEAPAGKDTTYNVTLTSITSCGENSYPSTVFVKAKPIAVFSPSKTEGCSPMLVNFSNTSPGGTNKYYYDFGDGSAVVEKTDKSPVNHTYRTLITQKFTVTMTAENSCGVHVKTYEITVYPQNMTPELVVDGQKRGCAPFTVNFDNNSIGASHFTFDFGDGGKRNTVTTGTEQYTFTKPGTYTVKMTAFNSCSEMTEEETIIVLDQPLPAFHADVTLGCADLPVQFRNTTQGGFTYVWDFGDGSPTSNELEPLHIYKGDQEYYTVTLTATNSLGCSDKVTRNQYIRVVPPPVAAFNVNPSTLITIPNYTFKFEDESTNTPTIWEWDFGDKSFGSKLKNPSHTYLDTGTYTVTLKAMNQHGCFTTTFKNVTIKGVPGYLFVPNSFIPGHAQPELREFSAKGSGIASWRFSVFNKWGQILWETTKLDEGRPAEAWDGTFNGQPLPQGVYYWKIDVQMINGTEWKGMTYDKSAPKRTGAIHLIR